MNPLAAFLYHLFNVRPPVSPKALDCVCKGECLCHAVGGLGAEECPFPPSADCVSGFDICHRCVCLNPNYRRPA
jgi:hypothetical protein